MNNEEDVDLDKKDFPTAIAGNQWSKEPSMAANADILGKLNSILENQTRLEQRMEKLEDIILNMKDSISKDRQNNTQEMLTQAKHIKENLVISSKVLKATTKLLGHDLDEIEIEIAASLPLRTADELSDFDKRFADEDFVHSVKTYLRKVRIRSPSVDDVFKLTINDNCCAEYNWDGRKNKRSLRSLSLFNTILYGVFDDMDAKEFEKQIRKSVELSHNRYKHTKLSLKRKLME